MDAIIMIGTEETETGAFLPARAFTLDQRGITDARQYVAMVSESSPYSPALLARLYPAGLRGSIPAGLRRERPVPLQDLFPPEGDGGFDEHAEALFDQRIIAAAIQSVITGENITSNDISDADAARILAENPDKAPRCVKSGPLCDGPVRLRFDGKAHNWLCVGHAPS